MSPFWGWVVLYRGIAPQGAVFYSIGHRPMDYAVANPHHQALEGRNLSYSFALHSSFSLSSSRSRCSQCVLMYTLQRAKINNPVAKIIVVALFSNRVLAVAIIAMRLITCSAISCLAFIVYCCFVCLCYPGVSRCVSQLSNSQ